MSEQHTFEYKSLSEVDAIGYGGTLNRLGACGWKLIEIHPSMRTYLFIRRRAAGGAEADLTPLVRAAQLESRVREIKAWIDVLANQYTNEEDGTILVDLKRNWPGAWMNDVSSLLRNGNDEK